MSRLWCLPCGTRGFPRVVRQAVALGLAVAGCSGDRKVERPAPPSASAIVSPPSSAAPVPSAVPYSIIETVTLPRRRHTVTVRLNEKVSEETLLAISEELKAQDPRRIRIFYLLPEMQAGAGAWATADFEREPIVEVLGPTMAEEKQMGYRPTTANRKVAGHWIDNSAGAGFRMTIYFEDGKPFLERQYKGRPTLTRQMLVERRSSSGRRFDLEDEISGTGGHYVIARNGHLEIRDNLGLIQVARMIPPEVP